MTGKRISATRLRPADPDRLNCTVERDPWRSTGGTAASISAREVLPPDCSTRRSDLPTALALGRELTTGRTGYRAASAENAGGVDITGAAYSTVTTERRGNEPGSASLHNNSTTCAVLNWRAWPSTSARQSRWNTVSLERPQVQEISTT